MHSAEQVKNPVITQQKINTSNLTRYHFDVISSTQDVAKEYTARVDSKNWVLVTADEQTKGRGVRSTSWASPPDVNIYGTFLFLIPKNKVELLFNIAQVAGWSVILTLESLGFKPEFKWLNDVLINKKKICGILDEADFLPHLEDHAAAKVGIGLNVNMSQEICDSLDQPVTSILAETGKQFDKEKILSSLQTQLVTNIELFLKSGFSPFAKKMAEKMAFLGTNVKIKANTSNAIFEGTIQGIDSDGSLLLEVKSKIQRLINCHIVPQRSINLIVFIGKTLPQFNFNQSLTTIVLQYINNDEIVINHVITPYFTALNTKKEIYGSNTRNVTALSLVSKKIQSRL